jgi:hypothetical protein
MPSNDVIMSVGIATLERLTESERENKINLIEEKSSNVSTAVTFLLIWSREKITAAKQK